LRTQVECCAGAHPLDSESGVVRDPDSPVGEVCLGECMAWDELSNVSC
jgi:hypothetical protein